MQEIQKGLRGENLVASTLQLYDDFNTQLIRNFPLRNDSDTGYYQIDIVLVCNRGIFSLEVKNWECIVECSAKNLYWKTIYPTREIMVKSPFLQNKVHCQFLCRLVNLPVSNLVVFSDKTQLRNAFRCTISCLDIANYLRELPVIYSDDEIAEVTSFLKKYKQEHDEQLFLDFLCKGMLNHTRI